MALEKTVKESIPIEMRSEFVDTRMRISVRCQLYMVVEMLYQETAAMMLSRLEVHVTRKVMAVRLLPGSHGTGVRAGCIFAVDSW